MRRALTPQGLRRVARECAAAEDRREAAVRAAATKARREATPPSELLSGWELLPEEDWTSREVLGCYAAAHLRAMGAEDPELKTHASREKLGHIVRRLLSELGEGESPREYIEWAVPEVVRSAGKRWPSDGTPAASSLVTGWILLKRWRAYRARRGTSRTRAAGKQWEEG